MLAKARQILISELALAEKTDEEQASASVPVVAVVTGEVNTLAVRDRLILRAYHTRAKTGMNLSRVFSPTVKGFNQAYGQSCKSWADVLTVTTAMLKGDR